MTFSKSFFKASVDEHKMSCCVQLRYSFFAPLHSDAGSKPALNPPKNTSTPPAPVIFPYCVWMVLQSSVRASSRLLASMAKYSSRSTSPGYFIALKRKLPAGRVCLPKMAALCTTERRALSKSGRKRSSNKARSLQREHVCLHPTFMQSAESMPSKSSFSFGTAFNWKKEAGSASHPGLKPKISFLANVSHFGQLLRISVRCLPEQRFAIHSWSFCTNWLEIQILTLNMCLHESARDSGRLGAVLVSMCFQTRFWSGNCTSSAPTPGRNLGTKDHRHQGTRLCLPLLRPLLRCVQRVNNLEERTHPEQVAWTSDVFPARSAVLALAGSPQETPCDCRHKSLQLNTRCTTHHVPK